MGRYGEIYAYFDVLWVGGWMNGEAQGLWHGYLGTLVGSGWIEDASNIIFSNLFSSSKHLQSIWWWFIMLPLESLDIYRV